MNKFSREENWQNFCKHHALGDWHGVLIKYAKSGKLIDKFQIIRSFYHLAEQDIIIHHNHYIFANGNTKSFDFGTHTKDTARGIYIDSSFSWGSQQVIVNKPFGSEIGIRQGNKRVSANFIYTEKRELQEMFLIIEELSGFDRENFDKSFKNFNPNDDKQILLEADNNLPGFQRVVTSSFEQFQQKINFQESTIRSENKIINFNPLQNIVIKCPEFISLSDDFDLVLDCQINSDLILRGIRNYSKSKFQKFIFNTFNSSDHEKI